MIPNQHLKFFPFNWYSCLPFGMILVSDGGVYGGVRRDDWRDLFDKDSKIVYYLSYIKNLLVRDIAVKDPTWSLTLKRILANTIAPLLERISLKENL